MEEDVTIIIDPEETELGGDPQGYDVRPRGDESQVTDSMSDSGEFVVLLPEDDNVGATQAIGALGITDSGDEWGTAETMRLDGGSTGQFGSVTEFLDSDDPYVAGATETYEQHDLSGPMSGSGGATEEVRLLLSNPGFGDPEATMAMDGQPAFDTDEEITGLPDLENVEDITALLDDVRTTELSAPDGGFDSEMHMHGAPSFSSGRRGLPIAKLGMAAAVLVLAALGYSYGPALYKKYKPEPAVAKTPDTPVAKDPEVPGKVPVGDTDLDPVATIIPQSEVQYRSWLVKSLVHNLNVSEPK